MSLPFRSTYISPITYIYGINGETRGEVVNGVTTLYDTNVIDYNPVVHTWSPVAGASASTGWVANDSDTVTCNSLSAHPYVVGDKFIVPHNTFGFSLNSGSWIPTGTYTIQSTPTSTSFTMTLDAGNGNITAGNGSFDGVTEFNLYRLILPPYIMREGDTLNISGHIYVVGTGNKTLKIFINDSLSVLTVNGGTSLVTAGDGTTEAFSASLTVNTDTYSGFSSQDATMSLDTQTMYILFRCLKSAGSCAMSLEDLTINLIRN